MVLSEDVSEGEWEHGHGWKPGTCAAGEEAAISLWSVSEPLGSVCLSFLSLSNLMIPVLSAHWAVLKTTQKYMLKRC